MLTVNSAPRVRRSLARAVVIAVVAVVATPVPAQADYFGPWYTDGAQHNFYYLSSNLGQTRYTAAQEARQYSLDNNTDMTTTLLSTSQYLALGTDRDVLAVMGDNPPDHPTWYAWTTCASGSGQVCTSFKVTISNTMIHSNYRAVFCHEFGHTVGLLDGQNGTHGPNSASPNSSDRSCMRSSPDWNYYSTHDKGHINGRY